LLTDNQIFAAGLDKLAALLSQVIGADDQEQVSSTGRSIDLVLRILDSTGQNPDFILSDNSVLGARHRLIDLISVALQSIERQLSSDEEALILPELTPPEPVDALKIVMKLLRFTLGLAVHDVQPLVTPKPDFKRLASSFLRVMAVSPPPRFVNSLIAD
jgi:mediator of RNA polymerase II transcription subunit 12